MVRARGKKASLNDDAKRYRRILDLEPKAPPFKGGPTLTLPIIRSRRDGVIAHLTDALDVEPFFSAKGLTEKGMEVSPIYEALMEKSLVAANGREAYLGALNEAVDVGTGIIGWSVAMSFQGEPVVQEVLPRFENFYAYPVAVNDFTNCTTFKQFREPWFVLKAMADEGLLDKTAVMKLRAHSASNQAAGPTTYEERDGSTDSDFSDEQRLHDLWECYVRWDGELWRVVYHEGLNMPLSAVLNPFREAFTAPPYEPMRIMRRPNYLWGMSIPRLLESIQKIADNAENSRLAYNTFALNPIVMADRLNPFLQQLQQGGLLPNQVIPTMGPPDMNGIKILEFPKPDVATVEVDMAQRFADLATFNDFQMSGDQFASSRRTATEVRTGFNIGTLKLRRMLRDMRFDLSRAAKKRWAAVEVFNVRPQGVVKVYQDAKQYWLSSDGVSREELQGLWGQFATRDGSPGVAQRLAELPSVTSNFQLVDGGIPSVKRDDVRWEPNGGDVIPDKQAELQKLDGFAPYLQLLSLASQDERVWHFLATRLKLMGRADWRVFVGENPRVRMEEQQYQQAVQQAMGSGAQGGQNLLGTQPTGGV